MAEEEWPCIWDPNCTEVFDSLHGRNSHKQFHNPYLTCEVCGRDDIKLMGDHLKKRCKGPPPEYEPHIEVDLRKWEYLEHRVPELEGLLEEAEAKIASMGRTADKRNSRIKSLEKQVERLKAK